MSDTIQSGVSGTWRVTSPAKNRTIAGKSPAGRPITLAEGVAAAKARVAADKLIPNAETPPKILQLAEVELFKS